MLGLDLVRRPQGPGSLLLEGGPGLHISSCKTLSMKFLTLALLDPNQIPIELSLELTLAQDNCVREIRCSCSPSLRSALIHSA